MPTCLVWGLQLDNELIHTTPLLAQSLNRWGIREGSEQSGPFVTCVWPPQPPVRQSTLSKTKFPGGRTLAWTKTRSPWLIIDKVLNVLMEIHYFKTSDIYCRSHAKTWGHKGYDGPIFPDLNSRVSQWLPRPPYASKA